MITIQKLNQMFNDLLYEQTSKNDDQLQKETLSQLIGSIIQRPVNYDLVIVDKCTW